MSRVPICRGRANKTAELKRKAGEEHMKSEAAINHHLDA